MTIAQLKKEMKENPPPSSTDWGLTIAWLLLRKGVVRGEKTSKIEMEKMFQKNIKLRDQFNAARLKIGLTEKEVEKVLKAKPIQNGKVEAGAFKIYGSTETLNVSDSYLYYTNILLVFEKGKVIGIYRIGGGERGIELSRQTVFSDLPPRK